MQIILINYEDWKRIFSRKFPLLQYNFAVCLETFFLDVTPAQKQKVSTLRVYFELEGPELMIN
jgi:hypothetical protein